MNTVKPAVCVCMCVCVCVCVCVYTFVSELRWEGGYQAKLCDCMYGLTCKDWLFLFSAARQTCEVKKLRKCIVLHWLCWSKCATKRGCNRYVDNIGILHGEVYIILSNDLKSNHMQEYRKYCVQMLQSTGLKQGLHTIHVYIYTLNLKCVQNTA